MRINKHQQKIANRYLSSIKPVGVIQRKNGVQDVLSMSDVQPKEHHVHNMVVGKLNTNRLCKRLHISKQEFKYYFHDLVRRGLLVDLSQQTRGDERK